MIAFVGAPFSPAYFRARRRSLQADPLEHCAFHVVIHGPGMDAWALSAYRRADVKREPDALVIGRNRIVRGANDLIIDIDERTMLGFPVRGRVRLTPAAWQPLELALDRKGRHSWWPVVPLGRIDVELDNPALRFSGAGYHDANRGGEALEQAFAGWRWTRGADRDGAAILYDVFERDGTVRKLGLGCDHAGRLSDLVAPARVELAPSRWGLRRTTRADDDSAARVRRTLVDAPFYARSWIDLVLGGRQLDAMHEVVDLGRFARSTTQLMLPFRTRGVGWR
ncbi:MAG TPA: hypothetical protein VG755_27345 [Nannocystaceae bacterium]|nr:hypothetical protein [Nannocystaceae bacterium]